MAESGYGQRMHCPYINHTIIGGLGFRMRHIKCFLNLVH